MVVIFMMVICRVYVLRVVAVVAFLVVVVVILVVVAIVLVVKLWWRSCLCRGDGRAGRYGGGGGGSCRGGVCGRMGKCVNE